MKNAVGVLFASILAMPIAAMAATKDYSQEEVARRLKDQEEIAKRRGDEKAREEAAKAAEAAAKAKSEEQARRIELRFNAGSKNGK